MDTKELRELLQNVERTRADWDGGNCGATFRAMRSAIHELGEAAFACLPALLDRIEALEDAASELLETADLRGDADLPHPEDDPKLWTARMQTAWEELRRCLTT